MNSRSSADPLPVVRTPFSTYWREFRFQVFPVLFFGALLAAIVILWRQAGLGGTSSGLGQGVQSIVSCPQAGRLQKVLVGPYQIVEAGEPLALIVPEDPQARLDLLRAELALLQLRRQPSVAEDNAMNFEQIRIEWLRTKSELAVARVNLERAENECRRNEPLRRDQLISEDVYDLSVKTRDALKAEVAEKTFAESLIQRRLAALESLGVPEAQEDSGATPRMHSRLEAMQATIATQTEPIVLTAPRRGMVQALYRQENEFVLAGDSLFAIHSLHSDFIVGYLRQPYPLEPKVGLKVQVTTRERLRRQFWSQIVQVGSQVEVITNALAYVRPGTLVDAGLPFQVSLPKGVDIRPGEIVDLWIPPSQDKQTANAGFPFRPLAQRDPSTPPEP